MLATSSFHGPLSVSKASRVVTSSAEYDAMD
jgi:hypothetical protein